MYLLRGRCARIGRKIDHLDRLVGGPVGIATDKDAILTGDRRLDDKTLADNGRERRRNCHYVNNVANLLSTRTDADEFERG